jgi:hypothetical protein
MLMEKANEDRRSFDFLHQYAHEVGEFTRARRKSTPEILGYARY